MLDVLEFRYGTNSGHEQVLTTLTSYGEVEIERQGEFIRSLGSTKRPNQREVEKIVNAVVREMNNSNTVK